MCDEGSVACGLNMGNVQTLQNNGRGRPARRFVLGNFPEVPVPNDSTPLQKRAKCSVRLAIPDDTLDAKMQEPKRSQLLTPLACDPHCCAINAVDACPSLLTKNDVPDGAWIQDLLGITPAQAKGPRQELDFVATAAFDRFG